MTETSTATARAEPVTLRLVTPPKWKRDERGRVQFWHPMWQRWQRLRRWTAPILEALERGDDWPTLVQIAHDVPIAQKAARIEPRLALFVFNLARLGHVELSRPAFVPDPEGRYQHVRELGRGGVAVADLVRERGTDRLAVAKRAWDFLQPYDVTERAIRHEADVMAHLDHPGIVHAVDRYEAGGHVTLVRDYVDGAEMTTLVASRRLDDETFCGLAIGIADILHHIHERGFLLVDLRPANWYLREDGRAMLIDVGQLRAHTGGRVVFEHRVGSRGFMSPEMRRQQVATVRSDLYGLGCLLLFLRTGQLPVADVDPDVVRDKLGDDAFGELIARLVDPDPASRPESAAAVSRALASPA